jgi:hypothetical protein
LWLLRLQIGITYFYGGLTKLNKDWLSGQIVHDWLHNSWGQRFIDHYVSLDFLTGFVTYGGTFFDLLIVPALLWKRTRVAAFCVAVFFHLSNSQLFAIGIFPWMMIAATLVFFEPDWPLRVAAKLRSWRKISQQVKSPFTNEEHAQDTHLDVSRVLSTKQKLTLTALGCYCTFQLLFPFRHFLYPGNVDWTEEAHRFSWRMMLRTKQGTLMYIVRDPATGEINQMDPQFLFHKEHLRKIAMYPEAILYVAHVIADDFRSRGMDVEVRAIAKCSMAGRKPQLLIDPSVDLAKEKRSLLPAKWIVPLTEPLPQREAQHSQHAGQ